MDHREPLCDITNQPAAGRRGLKRPKSQTDTALPDDHDHVLAALEAKRQKARDNYAKLTDEQKAQRINAKRREAYTLKKMRAVLQRSLLMLMKGTRLLHQWWPRFCPTKHQKSLVALLLHLYQHLWTSPSQLLLHWKQNVRKPETVMQN
ncbi:hypothetical protein PVAP13_4NG074538 [Panicum virgatum]|uniref:Uncharacterized protein n=1 Tax=Panicum virgatum TaxID=38727 RepID=A0A8T0T581_PANVG|nr:hypothetical protein PVAP13_4NG074538 [Panicum virgatum]